jgi:hypothetical protein
MKKTIENLDLPRLDSIPEYRVEADKLARFRVELGKCEARNIELHAALEAEQSPNREQPDDAQRIAEVERLLDGSKPVQGLVEQIRENLTLAQSLKRAIASQETVIREVQRELSKAAAKRFMTEHKARVKRVVDAFLELHAANEAEQSLRDAIESLGYDARTPFLAFVPPGFDSLDPFDKTGGFAPAWYREANEYAMTEEQHQANAEREAAATRRRKLASLT